MGLRLGYEDNKSEAHGREGRGRLQEVRQTPNTELLRRNDGSGHGHGKGKVENGNL